MGQVWEAQDETLGRLVAVKVISLLAGRGSLGGDARARFLREARITAQLQHPSIITIHDLGETGAYNERVPFLVMELVRGEGLDATLRRGAVALPDAARWGAQIGDALAEAHTAGIMHRDIKPSNILITPSGHVKVLDFGIARAADPYATGDRLTQTGFIVGTPPYMAPEQARGFPEPRSDLYALGCLLFELITGRLPFQAPDTVGYLTAHLTQEPPAPSTVSAAVPSRWDDIVLRLLHKDPAQRYPNAAELSQALRELDRASEPARPAAVPTPPATPPEATTAFRMRVELVAPIPSQGIVVVGGHIESGVIKVNDEVELVGTTEKSIKATVTGIEMYRRRLEVAQAGDGQCGLLLRGIENRRVEPGMVVVTPGATPTPKPGFRRGHDRGQVTVPTVPDSAAFAPEPEAVTRPTAVGPPVGYARVGSPMIGGDSPVSALAFSPDGSLLASSAADDGSLWLWNPLTRRPSGQPLDTRSTDACSDAVFSPDGSLLAVTGGDEEDTVMLWDPYTRQLVGELVCEAIAFTVVFSPDGSLLAVGDSRGTVSLWDPVNRQQVGDIGVDGDRVTSAVFSPDGSALATVASGKAVQLWDPATGRPIGEPFVDAGAPPARPGGWLRRHGWGTPKRPPGGFNEVAFSPDGSMLAAAGPGRVQLWDTASRLPIGQPLTSRFPFNAVAFSPDGAVLAAAGGDGQVHLWHPATGNTMDGPLDGGDSIFSLTFSRDGSMLATGDIEGAVHLYARLTPKTHPRSPRRT
ncbi:hypothetical protein GCM10010289_79680 [Streptomyces violascens]|nr:hypothetical protein GCM10010289_79680 [Streptomyces violascens]